MIARAVVQARMSSTRLPGKSLMDVAGTPLLGRVIDRARAMPFLDEIVVATSREPVDDAIERFVARSEEAAVGCVRADERDVLARFVRAVDDLAGEDVVVRLTADNPLYDAARSATSFDRHRERAADYTCVRGLSHVVPEFVGVTALRTMADIATGSDQREHVTPWLRTAAHDFRVVELSPEELGLDRRFEERLTIDDPADHERIDRLLRELEARDAGYTLEDVYAWLEARPDSGSQ